MSIFSERLHATCPCCKAQTHQLAIYAGVGLSIRDVSTATGEAVGCSECYHDDGKPVRIYDIDVGGVVSDDDYECPVCHKHCAYVLIEAGQISAAIGCDNCATPEVIRDYWAKRYDTLLDGLFAPSEDDAERRREAYKMDKVMSHEYNANLNRHLTMLAQHLNKDNIPERKATLSTKNGWYHSYMYYEEGEQ